MAGKPTQQTNTTMEQCIRHCLDCHRVCLETVSWCLQQGGKHAEARHIQTLLACAEICRASADFMLLGTDLHKHTCGACAEVCDACARSCEQMGTDARMKACVEACRKCAESCRQMAA
ncbi:MAG TPA: four-helix bundle copper-binding protein [Blastocatellia bacterium]|nr:four-helix bundle copper-binding protein [Blastocatellia bacterium]